MSLEKKKEEQAVKVKIDVKITEIRFTKTRT